MAVSYSIHSQILEQPIFQLAEGSSPQHTQLLINTFVDTLLDLSDQIYTKLKDKCQSIFKELEHRATLEKQIVNKSYYDTLIKKLDNFLKRCPTLGFNSSSYDLNLIKKFLIIALTEKTSIAGVIKRGSHFMSIFTPTLKFTDVRGFVAPGYSLDKYARAYTRGSHMKTSFCYEYLDKYEKLFETKLPPIQAFDSSLKNQN